MRLSELGLRNPYLLVVILLAVVVIGVVSMTHIPVDLLPIFKTPAVQIVTFYPGMPTEVMERDIMSRLERWTGQSVGIEHQEAKAMLGVCIVKDFFREDISFETAISQVTSYAMSDLYYLPPGTVPPMVMPFDPTASVPLCLVAVSSPTMTEKELYDIAYFELRNRLQSIQGVIAPAVYGGVLRRILAYVDPDKLQARGLSPMDVVEALRRQNVFIPAGNMKAGSMDYQIFVNSMPKEVEQLNDIPIKIVDGRPIFLRDVARAKDSHQIQSNVVRVNGRRQLYIPIYRQPGANTLQIVGAIRDRLAGILQRLRDMDAKANDLALEVVIDQSVYVRGSIMGLIYEAIAGAILAGLVVLLFLRNARSTLIVALAIPIAVLASFIGLFYSGASINAMTLGGLALAIGIVVDQSIVVLENIVRHLHEGAKPWDAAIQGVTEVGLPVLVSTVTFVVVFYPIVFLSGMAKFLFPPLAYAASFAIIASFVYALVIVPAFCGRYLRGRAHASVESEHDWTMRLSARYAFFVQNILKRRREILIGSAVLFVLALGGMTLLRRELFPAVDANQFQIQVRLPSGTRIERTEEVIKAVEDEIVTLVGAPDPEYPKVERHPESNLQILISNIGVLMDWPAAYTPNSGPMDAFMLVQLKGKRGKDGTFEIVSALRKRLRDLHPGVEFSFDTGGMLTSALNMGEPAPIHLQVAGSNIHTSHQIAREITAVMEGIPGVVDVRIAQKLDYPVLQVTLDRTKAAFVGLDVREVVTNLVTATNSSVNFNPAFWIDERNGNHYFIGAQYLEADLVSFETIQNIPLTGRGTKRPVLLRNVADFERTIGPAQINHRNITRVIDIFANVAPGKAVGTTVDKIEKALRQTKTLGLETRQSEREEYYAVNGPEYQGKGYSLSVQGEVAIMRNAFGQFLGGLIIASILVYLVMVAQLRSFRDPFIIMLTVPLGFIGVTLVLGVTSTALNIQSLMGIIMMVGIVVAFSVVLVDFANRRLREGLTVTDAVIDAARKRLRPILMTSMATVLAIAPMAIGMGGSDVNMPLARAILGGVLGATVLSLVVVPCLYVTLKLGGENRGLAEIESHD